MRQLSALDAWLLDLESPTSAGHVGTLIRVDPGGVVGGWGAGQVRALLESRLHTLGRLRQRLVSAPWPLGGRYLVDDPHFDVEFHVRELGLPSPGTTQQLAEQVAGIHARPLDRGRPMWELYVVSGCEDGLTAVYAKIHRTLVDPGGGLVSALLDPSPEPSPTGPAAVSPEHETPAAVEMIGQGLRSLLSDPREATRVVPAGLHRLGRLSAQAGLPGARIAEGLAEAAGRLLGPRLATEGRDLHVPRTRLDAPLTAHRRLAFGSVPLEPVTRAAVRLSMTEDDLVRTAAATALRLWFLDHDALPPVPLVAAVPVPVHGSDDPDAEAVGMTPVLVEMPTHLRDMAERVAATRESLHAATQGLDVVVTSVMEDPTSETAGADLVARTMSGLAFAPGSTANLTVSHQPGPSTPLYLAGAEVVQVLPLASLGPATGGLAVTSYAHDSRLHLCLTACREIVPDVCRVLEYLLEALDELTAADAG